MVVAVVVGVVVVVVGAGVVVRGGIVVSLVVVVGLVVVVTVVVVVGKVVGWVVVLLDRVTYAYGVGVGGRITQSSVYTHLLVTSSRTIFCGQRGKQPSTGGKKWQRVASGSLHVWTHGLAQA